MTNQAHYPELQRTDHRRASGQSPQTVPGIEAGILHSVVRFMLVGALGTLIDFCLFAVLSAQFSAPTILANTLSYSAGIVNNYFLHRKWSFVDRPPKVARLQFMQFVSVSLSALVLNNLMVFLLVPLFSPLLADSKLAAMCAKVCATGVGMCWNFVANHLWVFETRTK